jgi:thiol:disulfide interchange protein DsbD
MDAPSKIPTHRRTVPAGTLVSIMVTAFSFFFVVMPIALGQVGGVGLESSWAQGFKEGRFSFGMILVVVFLGGLFTNFTPCVYPMIPITLRLLGRQGASPFTSGSLYAGGILLTYTTLGVSAALSGSLFANFMASTAFNVVFAVVMIALGLSMLGFGNFAALQAIGARLGAGRPSHRNTLLMGAGAGLVAAPCTGPILAALLAYTAGTQDVGRGAFLLFIYSFGFAIPYVFLGGVAAKLAKVKVSPNIQIGVKILFASIMFSLALYYLRIPAYGLFLSLSDAWAHIAIVSAVLGSGLLLTWLVIPRLRDGKLLFAIPSLIFGVAFFAASQTMNGKTRTQDAATAIVWIRSEEEAYRKAKERGLPILVDGWAEWCAACKKMDVTTFVDQGIVSTLNGHWVTLKLDLTESTEANDQLIAKYKLSGLPALVLVPPDGDLEKRQVIGGYVEASTLLGHIETFKKGMQ